MIAAIQSFDKRWALVQREERKRKQQQALDAEREKKQREEATKIARAQHREQEQKRLEQQRAERRAQYGSGSEDDDEDEDDDDEEIDESLVCRACRMVFRTLGQRQNHDNTKKHRINFAQWIEEHPDEVEGDDSGSGEEQIVEASDDEKSAAMASEPSEEDEDPDAFCAICDKQFATPAHLQQHERSKAHLNKLRIVQREMRAQDAAMKRSQSQPAAKPVPVNTVKAATPATKPLGKKQQNKRAPSPSSSSSSESSASTSSESSSSDSSSSESSTDSDSAESSSSESSSDSSSSSAAPVRRRRRVSVSSSESESESEIDSISAELSSASISDPNVPPKGLKGAKLKRWKQAQRAKQPQPEPEPSESAQSCSVCKQSFPSRSSLFRHLESTGHAVPLADQVSSSTKKRK